MELKVEFLDGDAISIDSSTKIKAWRSLVPTKEDNLFYLAMCFEGCYQDGTQIGTCDPVVGIQGLIGTTDWLQFGNEKRHIKTSAIKSVTLVKE